jgi:hypothetical protein
MKKEYLLLSVLLLLAYAYYARNRTQSEVVQEPARPRSQIEQLPANSAPQAAPVVTGLTPAEHGQTMALGIRQTVLPAKNAETIGIRFKKKLQWCMVGDLDFIRSQSVKADREEWRLSLELDKPVSSVNVKLEDMMDGRSLSLPFPAKDGVYALYLCRNAGRGSCLNQKLWDPTQRSTKRLEGVVINAQILVRSEGRIMVLPTDNWSRATDDQLKTTLRKQKLQDNGRLDSLYQTIGRLKPLAAQFDEKGLALPLTLNDPNCMRQR